MVQILTSLCKHVAEHDEKLTEITGLFWRSGVLTASLYDVIVGGCLGTPWSLLAYCIGPHTFYGSHRHPGFEMVSPTSNLLMCCSVRQGPPDGLGAAGPKVSA